MSLSEWVQLSGLHELALLRVRREGNEIRSGRKGLLFAGVVGEDDREESGRSDHRGWMSRSTGMR